MKTVLIVAAGSWGALRPEDEHYKMWVNYCKDIFERKGAKVIVVGAMEDVERRVEEEQVSAVIFISRGMLRTAEELAGRLPEDVRIVVFTSLREEMEKRVGRIEVFDKLATADNSEVRAKLLA